MTHSASAHDYTKFWPFEQEQRDKLAAMLKRVARYSVQRMVLQMPHHSCSWKPLINHLGNYFARTFTDISINLSI